MELLSIQETPINKLSTKINGNEIFIKRDDLIPFSFGGNKVRKCVFFFNEIIHGSYDHVITYGSSSSNHCRVVSNFAYRLGLRCTIISPSEQAKETFNRSLIELLNAEIVYCQLDNVSMTISELIATSKEAGNKPYFIQGGGHGIPGTEAYVQAYREIENQEKKLGLKFDYIFLCSGTGSTQAGLVCGSIINSKYRNIIGISNARKNPRGKSVVEDAVIEYLSAKAIDFKKSDLQIDYIDDYICGGYGSFNSDIKSVVLDIFRTDGVPLDLVYTGKAYWGMLDYIKTRGIHNSQVLFIHTGGGPLFFDYLGEEA